MNNLLFYVLIWFAVVLQVENNRYFFSCINKIHSRVKFMINFTPVKCVCVCYFFHEIKYNNFFPFLLHSQGQFYFYFYFHFYIPPSLQGTFHFIFTYIMHLVHFEWKVQMVKMRFTLVTHVTCVCVCLLVTKCEITFNVNCLEGRD